MSWLSKILPSTSPLPALKITGKGDQVFDIIRILATTWPIDEDPRFWELRMWHLFEWQNWRN